MSQARVIHIESVEPARADFGDYPECEECAWADSDACDDCDDADLFEPEDALQAA